MTIYDKPTLNTIPETGRIEDSHILTLYKMTNGVSSLLSVVFVLFTIFPCDTAKGGLGLGDRCLSNSGNVWLWLNALL